MESHFLLKEPNDYLRNKLAGTPQKELSTKSGIAQPSISQWIRGLNFGIKQLNKLANSFGYSVKIECYEV